MRSTTVRSKRQGDKGGLGGVADKKAANVHIANVIPRGTNACFAVALAVLAMSSVCIVYAVVFVRPTRS